MVALCPDSKDHKINQLNTTTETQENDWQHDMEPPILLHFTRMQTRSNPRLTEHPLESLRLFDQPDSMRSNRMHIL